MEPSRQSFGGRQAAEGPLTHGKAFVFRGDTPPQPPVAWGARHREGVRGLTLGR